MFKLNSVFDTSRSILQEIDIPEFKDFACKLFVKRDDLIHEEVSGNKWRKLKYNIPQGQQNRAEGILTFGGAYSNHLVATASACHQLGIKSIGIVRGDELNCESNDTLKKCANLNMELHFFDRMNYAMRNDYEYLKELKEDFPNYYIVPEGGANFYGMVGCQEIWDEIPFQVDHLFVAQGTTTTSCGLLLGNKNSTKIHVVPVLKGFDAKMEMEKMLYLATFDNEISEEYLENCIIHGENHFGGYAKHTLELISFIKRMFYEFDLPLDHVYTGKAFFALYEWIKNLENKDDLRGKNIVFLHTGGLQASHFYKEDSNSQ
ncbi:MAG: 1-aminocyclopropane-1-carboxylate deaminase/D-cysteine desulfhydrase [Flavobacteriia bacterium]|jgi:1-aminocyclopropane-1-carboxylate deaminase